MKPISKEEFEKRIKNRFPEEKFEVQDFNGLGKPAVIKCLNCGRIIEVSKASNFLIYSKAQGCKNCQSDYVIKYNKYLDAIKEKYDILEKYQQKPNDHFRYKIKCKKCGHIRDSYLINLYNHLDCGCETGVIRRTPEEFELELSNKKNNMYEPIEPFNGMSNPILIRHKECGFIWKVRPQDLLYERSADCPNCKRKMSKGAIIIYQTLKKQNIPFYTEYPVGNTKLRFDFFFKIGNQQCAIEFNGKQHYKHCKIFQPEYKDFLNQVDRDNRKREYCKNNSIKLLEIPYTCSPSEINAMILQFLQEVQRLK